jgi:hypothetical protein
MPKHLNLGDRAFLVVTGTVAGLGFALSERDFESLAFYWAGYLVIMSLVGMFRLGFARGMAIPAFGMAVVGILHPAILAQSLSVWLLAPMLYCVVPFARAVIARIMRRVARRSREGAPELVSVAVGGRTSDVNAADVLAQFGFARTEDE